MPFNWWLFNSADNIAFHKMLTELRTDDPVGKSKEKIAAAYGRPYVWNKSLNAGIEEWSYSPGPLLSYGSFDSIILIFRENHVVSWHIDWF